MNKLTLLYFGLLALPIGYSKANETLADAVMIDPALKSNVRIAGGIDHIEDGSVEIIFPAQPINVAVRPDSKNKPTKNLYHRREISVASVVIVDC